MDAYKCGSGGEELSRIIHRKFKKLRKFLDKDPPMEERKRAKKH